MKEENEIVELPYLKNIAMMMTYKCTIACPHCIVEAGPHRTEEMNMEDSFQWLEQAGKYRDGYIQGLALTGGEPFFNTRFLREITDYGSGLGFVVSVVTSAFWAGSPREAHEMLEKFPNIRMLAISTDKFHQHAIPIENIKNAFFAAKELGVDSSIAVCTPNVNEPEYIRIREQLLEFVEENKIRVSITFPVGRALKRAKLFDYQKSTEPSPASCSMASSPVIFPDGSVIGCIGPVINLDTKHPLLLGNLYQESLEEILDRAELNTALHAIRLWGPNKLFSQLQSENKNELLPKEYIKDSLCDVCHKLFENPEILEFLEKNQNQNPEFQQKVAYGRYYYLKETRMLEMLGLVTR